MITAQRILDNIGRWARGFWYGDRPFFGHLFLVLAVWNTFVTAINVTVWPRVYDPQMLTYMKPVNVVFPIIVCLALASLSKGLGLRPILRAYTEMGVIALITFALWNHQSEAWLNQYGYHLLN